MRPPNTLPAFRLRNIWRYNVVNMPRRQSVAEHSYLVWAIGMHLYDKCVTDYESLERGNLSEALLLHDLEEAWTSDIPANLKAELQKVAPGALKKATGALSLPLGGGPATYATGHWTETLVKLADAAEAYLFCRENGAPDSVVKFLSDRVDELVNTGKKHREHGRFDWAAAEEEIWCIVLRDSQEV